MKKDVYIIFLKTLQKADYTMNELYEYFKDFCQDNILPCSSIGIFREKIEPIIIEEGHTIQYASNGLKIKKITFNT